MYLNTQHEIKVKFPIMALCLNTRYAIDTSHIISLLFITF